MLAYGNWVIHIFVIFCFLFHMVLMDFLLPLRYCQIWGRDRETEMQLSEPNTRYHKKIMKGGGDGKRLREKDTETTQKAGQEFWELPGKPGKWKAIRGEAVSQSHFKDKCNHYRRSGSSLDKRGNSTQPASPNYSTDTYHEDGVDVSDVEIMLMSISHTALAMISVYPDVLWVIYFDIITLTLCTIALCCSPTCPLCHGKCTFHFDWGWGWCQANWQEATG